MGAEHRPGASSDRVAIGCDNVAIGRDSVAMGHPDSVAVVDGRRARRCTSASTRATWKA
jgi:hypothetical protein